jgi:hypothetical protein
MTDLSGRVLDLEKQILALPTQADWSALQVQSSSRFNVVEGNISDLINKFNELNLKVVNLQLYGNTGQTGNHQHVSCEVPSGSVNGVNVTFTVSQVPVPSSSLHLYKNGMLQKEGTGNDYQLNVRTITFSSDNVPEAGSNILASYMIP